MSNWYVLHVYSGFEDRIAAEIRLKAEADGLLSHIKEIITPKQNVTKVKSSGSKVTVDKVLMPGYLLINMEGNEALIHMINNLQRVVGFLGGNKPKKVSEKEIEAIFLKINSLETESQQEGSYVVGDRVQINSGPFVSFNGVIEEVDTEKNKLKVSVSIFGRATPVELQFNQVSKVE